MRFSSILSNLGSIFIANQVRKVGAVALQQWRWRTGRVCSRLSQHKYLVYFKWGNKTKTIKMHRRNGCTLSNKDRVHLCVSSRRRGVDLHKRSKKSTSLDDTPRIIHLATLKRTSAHTHCCVQNKYPKMRTTFVVGSRLVSGMAQFFSRRRNYTPSTTLGIHTPARDTNSLTQLL